MDLEFTIDGINYKAGKLNAFQQFHVSRKIAPIIPTLIPVFIVISKKGDLKDLSAMAELLQPFADGLSNLSDESAEYVLGTCLSVVKRQDGEHWSAVWNQNLRRCMYDDIDLGIMIKICIKIIQDSLGGFISGLATIQQASPMTPEM